MREKIVRRMTKTVLLFMGCICCFILMGKITVLAEETVVTASDKDVKVFPDLYNTGPIEPEGGFTVVSDAKLPCTVDGEETTLDGASTDNRFVLNVKYKHSFLNGKIVIENVDLSHYKFVIYNPEILKEQGRKLSFVFNNCKLNSFSGGTSSCDELSFEFNNCSFLSAYGSDITFNSCRFGGGINDRLNLFVNCYVNDCYIYNPSSEIASEGEIHVDGIQIYGNNKDSSIKTENIHFDNCRFEMPPIRYSNAPKTYVNACIMLQTEFSDGDNMSFENCYVNGGGYAIYAHGVKGTRLSNITFKNLYFGCAARYGRLYPDKPEKDQVEWNEDTWEDAASVYVGTVDRDKDKNETYLCVSNDTNKKRYFRAYTSNGHFYDYSIEACPTYKEYSEKGLTFEEFPFDRLYTIPEYCEWVVVYEMMSADNSTSATMNQVRFQNWIEEKSVKLEDVSAVNLEYELSEDGTLTISGFGNMPEFSSVESIPWYSEKEKIKKIVIKDVTSISANTFSDCVNLEEVVLHESFESIGKEAFLNCISLVKVTFPESIVSVGSDAFSIDTDTYQEARQQMDVYYGGALSKWVNISFATTKSNPMYMTGGNLYVNGSELATEFNAKDSSSTYVGSNVFAGCLSLAKVDLTGVTEIGSYAFSKSGVSGEVVIPETIKRFGTYAFGECTSLDKLIWQSSIGVAMGAFNYDTNLREIVISGNSTTVSNWAFKGCSNLVKVTLPDTVTYLSQQSFQNCSALKEINIPEGVTGIGNYAFGGCTSLEQIIMPDTVNSLGIGVFAYCTGLKDIHLSSGLTDLGNSCFSKCVSLETVELPATLTSISSGAFNECSSLKTIKIPASVTEIKSRALYKCKLLSSIYFMEEECPAMATDVFDYDYIKTAAALVYIPENATAYTENELILKIASHLYSTKVIAVANCIEPGKEQYTCLLHDNCESNYEKITDILEHQPGEPVFENVVPATSEKEGSYDEVYYCIVCKQELSREKKVAEKLPQEDTTTTGETTGKEPEETTGKEPEETTGKEPEETTGKEPEETTGKEPEETTGKEPEGTTGNEPEETTEKETEQETTKKVTVKAATIKSAVNKKNNEIEVTWGRISGATGYEVQYGTYRNFKKGVHTKRITGASKIKTTIKGLQYNKKYYVRIRVYKKVNGKKYVSKWSAVKQVTVKKITVKSTALKKVVNKKNKKIEVTWRKIKGVTGYEVQYSTYSNFKKGVRTKRITGASKGKVTITGLKKNKKYYVRVRAYKKVNGKKYVSKWSGKKV